MENMEIAWEDFILEEPRTSKSFVQPRTSSRSGSRKQSVDSKTSKASGDSNVIYSKATVGTSEKLLQDVAKNVSEFEIMDSGEQLLSTELPTQPAAP
jgi:hypothetical protein